MASLLTLPTELRLNIFSHLLCAQQASTQLQTICTMKPHNDYDDGAADAGVRLIANAKRPVLFFRNIDPMHFRLVASATWPCFRNVYDVRCDRFRSRVSETTYECTNHRTFDNDLNLLLVNNQIHTEAARVFYGGYTFNFNVDVEAIAPFLDDLTPFARSCIKSVAFIKRALPYDKEYDRCEWSNAMHFLSNPRFGIQLQDLHIGIIAGRPGKDGWTGVEKYTREDFDTVIHTDNMSWLRDLAQINDLHSLDVYAVVEQCPAATNSSAMVDYIKFSASIETGLTAFMQDRMLRQK